MHCFLESEDISNKKNVKGSKIYRDYFNLESTRDLSLTG